MPDRLTDAMGNRRIESKPDGHRRCRVGRPDPPGMGQPSVRIELRWDLVAVLREGRRGDALDLVGSHRVGRLVMADEVHAAPRRPGLEEVGVEARSLRLACRRLVGELDDTTLGPSSRDAGEGTRVRFVRSTGVDRQHRGVDVPRDRLRQRVGDLREGAHDRGVVLVAPAADETRGEEEDDGLRHAEPQGRQEELAIDAVVPARSLEDGDSKLLLQRTDVAIDRSRRHAGQLRDLGDRDPGLAAPPRVQDRGHAQQACQTVALLPQALVAGILVPAAPIGHHAADSRPMPPYGPADRSIGRTWPELRFVLRLTDLSVAIPHEVRPGAAFVLNGV